MKTLKKILVPVDLSENSVQTLQQAIDIADRSHAQVILLHTYFRPLAKLRGEKSYEKSFFHSLEKGMLYWKEHRVKSHFKMLFEETATSDDVKFTIVKKKGLLLEKTMEVIRRFHIDLVIMGLNSRNKGKNLWNYRVARLSKKVKVPLLILPAGYEMSSPIKIAFAYDLRAITDFAKLNIVRIFSSIYDSEIQIFTVKKEDRLSEEETKNLDKLKEFFEGFSPAIHIVKDTDVERGILHFLSKHQVSMVVTIHRTRNALARLFHKSMSKRMATISGVPVLTIEED